MKCCNVYFFYKRNVLLEILFNLNYFLDEVSNLLDNYSRWFSSFVIMDDFNAKAEDLDTSFFMPNNELVSLIKTLTCFKSKNCRCIDLILTNRQKSFQKSSVFETGISDHHLLIYTIFKAMFEHLQLIRPKYRSYKSFSEEVVIIRGNNKPFIDKTL